MVHRQQYLVMRKTAMNRQKTKVAAYALTLVALWLAGAGAQDPSIEGYVVGPGDVLEIQVWDNSDLNRSVVVSQQGTFSFPFVGSLAVSNLSVAQIEKLLVKKLSEGYLVDPQVSISVSDYRNQKVFIFGEVRSPGSYVLRHRTHLLEMISEAGGFTNDSGATCVIVRPVKNGDKIQSASDGDNNEGRIIRVDLEQLMSAPQDHEEFYVMPGDSIHVSRSENIFVTGEVRNPGKYSWEKGLTVRQAISIAGGGTLKASLRRVEIIRNEDGAEKTIKPNLSDPVRPNDIIKVPLSYF